MTHIVIATGLYPPEIGGPATFASLFEKGLAKHSMAHTTIPFSSVRYLPKLVRHVAYGWRVYRAASSDSIVLALDPVSVGLPSLLAARARGARFFLRVGGDYAWEQATQRSCYDDVPESFPGDVHALPLPARIMYAVQRYVAVRAERVLVQSTSLGAIVAAWGVAASRISVVPNGMSAVALPDREALRARYGWHGPVVVSSGRFVPWKGFEALIDAVKSLGDIPDLHLVIIGGGPLERELRSRADGAVEFIPPLPKSELLSMISAADVFALNTRYEGFSHQILEAMSVGTPVVTTAIPGNADLVVGETALSVPWNDTRALADSVRRVIEDPALARSLSLRARAHAEQFTPERTFRESCAALGISV